MMHSRLSQISQSQIDCVPRGLTRSYLYDAIRSVNYDQAYFSTSGQPRKRAWVCLRRVDDDADRAIRVY